MKRLIYILLGSLLYAVAACVFVMPSHIALGGTTGLAVLISQYIKSLSAETISSLMNVLLLIPAFIILGKGFAFGTLAGSVLTTLFIFLFGVIFPNFAPLPMGTLLNGLVGAFLIGFASFFLFAQNASSGGTDIIALIVKKFSRADISGAVFLTDILIVLSSFLVYGAWVGFCSSLGFLMKIVSLWLFGALYRRKQVRKSGEKKS